MALDIQECKKYLDGLNLTDEQIKKITDQIYEIAYRETKKAFKRDLTDDHESNHLLSGIQR